MTKYIVIVNERDGDDETDFEDIKYDICELLRSGYFDVESVKEM